MSAVLAKVSDLRLHDEAGRVPRMRPAEYAEFLADIRERGVRVPIELQPGTKTILDGRCRYLAAQEAGLTHVPVAEAQLNGEDPVVYILRMASKRRHLTDDQRAMLADEEREWLAAKGRERQRQAAKAQGDRGKEGGRGNKKPPEAAASSKGFERTEPKATTERARETAAKVHNTSPWKVRQAQAVKTASPELAEKVKNGEVPLAQAARHVLNERRTEELERKAEEAAKVLKSEECPYRLINGDSIAELKRLSSRSARLIFADPPYNIGIDYGTGKKADLLPNDEYMEWVEAWLRDCKTLLTDDGSLWVLIGDEYAAEYGVAMKKLGLTVRAWIKWYETFGVNCANNFNRCSRHLFYCVVNPKRFVFNASAVNRPSDRQTKYQDGRANPGGKIWDDVWQIPRLVGTAKERIPTFPTQVPLELLLPIISCASDSGDTVIDPFAGSATTGCAAITLGRKFIGIEKNAEFFKAADMRLKVACHDSVKASANQGR